MKQTSRQSRQASRYTNKQTNKKAERTKQTKKERNNSQYSARCITTSSNKRCFFVVLSLLPLDRMFHNAFIKKTLRWRRFAGPNSSSVSFLDFKSSSDRSKNLRCLWYSQRFFSSPFAKGYVWNEQWFNGHDMYLELLRGWYFDVLPYPWQLDTCTLSTRQEAFLPRNSFEPTPVCQVRVVSFREGNIIPKKLEDIDSIPKVFRVEWYHKTKLLLWHTDFRNNQQKYTESGVAMRNALGFSAGISGFEISGVDKQPVFSLVVSTGWFQIFTLKMVVSPNIYSNMVV